METDVDVYRHHPVNFNKIDLSYLQLSNSHMEDQLMSLVITSKEEKQPYNVQTTNSLYLHENLLTRLPVSVYHFERLRILDLSSNRLEEIGDEILQLVHLTALVAKNNQLSDESLPKNLGCLTKLEELNLSANNFSKIVPQIFELENLKGLFLGGNQLTRVSSEIKRLKRLKVLYLGGNYLQEIPVEMGHLIALQVLILCDNQLESLPSTISHLHQLRSLALHKNKLTTLPPEIIQLKALVELSLRDNPLVVRFVRQMMYNPPSLLELSARTVKTKNISYSHCDLPRNLLDYLQTAHSCVNPKCRGVYFDAPVEHIKFVDFCGKYRIPLLQYLCSPRCTTHPAVYNSSSESELSEDDGDVPMSRLKKVLLG